MTVTKPGSLALSVAEVCRESGLGRTLVYEAIGSGDLPARKAGRRTLILRADLETWLGRLPCFVDTNAVNNEPDRDATR